MRKSSIWLIAIVVILGYFFSPFFVLKSVYPLKYKEEIVRYSQKNDLAPSLVASLVYNESRFDAKAVSNRKAYGLMQVQPATAKDVLKRSVSKEELKDPTLNLKVGCRYLKKLLVRYSDKLPALIAYNLGPTSLDNKLKKNQPLEEIGSSYGFAQQVLHDRKVYEKVYPSLSQETPTLSTWQAWKIIFTGKL